MSDPKYRPRDFLVQPKMFGKYEEPVWASGGGAARLKSAQLQHWLAFSALRWAKSEGKSQSELAQLTFDSVDRMGRILRGEVVMRMEDMFALLSLTEVDLRVGVRRW